MNILQVDEIECYNPLTASSGLFQCLKNKNKKPEPKQQKRKPETVSIICYAKIFIFFSKSDTPFHK
jgi:hypothetical protein